MEADLKTSLYALVIADQKSSTVDLTPVERVVTLAAKYQCDSHVLVVGKLSESDTDRITVLSPKKLTLIHLPNEEESLLAEQQIHILQSLINSNQIQLKQNDCIFIAADSEIDMLSGQFAAQISALPLGKCNEIEISPSGYKVTRHAFGGRLKTVTQVTNGPLITTVRSSPSNIQYTNQSQTTVQNISITEVPEVSFPRTLVARQETHAGLDGAKLIFAGGRGLNNSENFNLLYDLASKFNGAVAGSLPTIDAGWAPVSRQVGQSGKFVSPEHYIAIGISGTPQHLAGIAPQSKIIAINNDPEAPIFKHAHIGIIADLNEFLPLFAHEAKI